MLICLSGAEHLRKSVAEGIGKVIIFLFENRKAFYRNICFNNRSKIGNIAHIILIRVDDSGPNFCNNFRCKIIYKDLLGTSLVFRLLL